MVLWKKYNDSLMMYLIGDGVLNSRVFYDSLFFFLFFFNYMSSSIVYLALKYE